MNDKILEMFFEPERWQYAIAKGVDKDMPRKDLIELCDEHNMAQMYVAIRDGRYTIAPPHTALIPKDKSGEFRTVYINEPKDRVLLSIANDLFIELMPEMIHPRCKSYQKGIGCGKIVKEVSHRICDAKGDVIGWKSDLSKYFDSVPLRYIDDVFDKIEAKHGKSQLVKVIRDYYHCDWYFNTDGELVKNYQSLKQGCSVASFLANAICWHIDEAISKMDGYYVRYSDDMLFIGKDYRKAMSTLEYELSKMEMKLNPKKVEYLTHTRWFKFLGFSIKGADISLSSTRIKTFQKEIQKRTVKDRKQTFKHALKSVNNYLYRGNGEFSWATQVLSVVNVKKDIDTLNKFVMDCLRAVQTGKRRVGGLGYVVAQKEGCIQRGTGRNVSANRQKTETTIDGYLTLGCMQNAMRTNRNVYDYLIKQM